MPTYLRLKSYSRRTAMGIGAAAVAALTMSASDSFAQSYPTKPIKIIVPGDAGGGMDVIARVVAEKMSQSLKQPIVIENKAGAGGNIAVDLVAKSPADGYTILAGQTAHFAINPWLYSKLPFDAMSDFIPVVLLADSPNVMVVPASSSSKSLADVLAAAKANTQGMPLATPGNGTVSHLTAEMLQTEAGVKFTHVPYKGAAGALTDVMGGRIPVMLSSVPTALSQIRAGKLRPVAVSAKKRSPSLPDIPTIGEQGYPQFDAGTWYGLLVPKGVPAPIVEALNKAANDAIKLPDVRDKIRQEGGDVAGSTSAEFASMVKADYEKWGKVVKQSGAKVD